MSTYVQNCIGSCESRFVTSLLRTQSSTSQPSPGSRSVHPIRILELGCTTVSLALGQLSTERSAAQDDRGFSGFIRVSSL